LAFECSDETGICIGEVAGQLIIISHVDGVDEYVVAVCRSKRSQTNISVAPSEPLISGFATVAADGEVLRVGAAIVPACPELPGVIHCGSRLAVGFADAEVGRDVAVDLDRQASPVG